MNTLHRLVGLANVILLILIFLLAKAAVTMLGGGIIIAVFLALYLVVTVWGARNAIHYWRGSKKLTVTDHILLSAGALNGLLLLTAIVLFIYIGEN